MNKQCLICLEDVENIYCKINHEQEKQNKYHIICLEQWFKQKTIGLITRENVNSYSIYDNDIKIEERVIYHENIISDNENHLFDDIDEPERSLECINLITDFIKFMICFIIFIIVCIFLIYLLIRL